MNSRSLILAAAAVLALTTPAVAQTQPARVEVSLYPISDLFIKAGDTATEPSFRSYTPGVSVFVRLTWKESSVTALVTSATWAPTGISRCLP
jgi:hypothetical protein